MRIISLLILLGIIVTPAVAQTKIPEHSPGESCPQRSKLEDEQKFADFVIRVYRGEEFDGCVQVLKNDQIVFSQHTEAKFGIGNDINGDDVNKDAGHGVFHPPAIPLGTDVTGLGKPNLILNEWSGGAHCCYAFHVFELTDHPREIATVQADESDYAHFEDVNHDGVYEFVGWDFTFAYWRTGFTQSPAPRIVLRFNGKGYELAPDLMRQPPPAPKQLKKTEIEVRNEKWEDGNPPPLLWGTMLDLIYTGNSDLAWKFIDASWIPKDGGKDEFLQDFCSQLATSPYFPKLRSTISTAPCKFNPKRRNDDHT